MTKEKLIKANSILTKIDKMHTDIALLQDILSDNQTDLSIVSHTGLSTKTTVYVNKEMFGSNLCKILIEKFDKEINGLEKQLEEL